MTGTPGSSSSPARAGMSAVGRCSAPGTCPCRQARSPRESTRTKPGDPDASEAATSDTSAWNVSRAVKKETASAAAAGGGGAGGGGGARERGGDVGHVSLECQPGGEEGDGVGGRGGRDPQGRAGQHVGHDWNAKLPP